MNNRKLDQARALKIVDLVRAGSSIDVAATAAGVEHEMVRAWLSAGARQRRGRHRDFADAVARARAEGEARDVALLARAASDDWKAAAWRLERQSPVNKRGRGTAGVSLEIALGRLERGLDAETYQRVLALIAGVDPHTLGKREKRRR